MIVIERELDRIEEGVKTQNPCPFFPVTSFILPLDSIEAFHLEGFSFYVFERRDISYA
ncbi:hypothetical protein MASR2M70_06810 [Bacillota bacterium]